MSKFYTKFDMKPFVGSEMNPYDAVDRLSYVDSTQQIVRMMTAGVNMKLQNSQLMAYDGDMNAPSMQVYAPDISVAYKQLHELQDKLKENQRKNDEAYAKALADRKAKTDAYMKSLVSGVVSSEKSADSDLPSST